MHFRIGVVAMAVVITARSAQAQCADGGAPPCKTQQVARRDPPISDNTWLVLPFENSANVKDADLIGQASVTLLTQELGRWRDVLVVPDDRVADMLRQLPEAQRRSPGLDASLAMAKRVGAGRILIGNFFAVAGRANLTAKSYDTRTGSQVRVVNERVNGFLTDAGLDSLSAVFGRLGRAVLNVQATADRGGAVSVGTTSMPAYRAFQQGMEAYTRMRMDSAAPHFQRAIATDSTFAMAHLYLGNSLAYLGDAAGVGVEYAAAARYTDALSPHARLVVAFVRGNRESHCGTAADLLKADSSDAWGWRALASCQQRSGVELGPSGPHFVGNMNAAARSIARALELDARNPEVIAEAISALMPVAKFACASVPSVSGGICPSNSYYWGAPLVAGDTFVVPALKYSDDPFRHPSMTRAAAAARRVMLNRFKDLVARWTTANPGQWYGHWNYSYALLGLGDLVGAEGELLAAHEAAQIPQARRFYYRDRVELALRRDRVAEGAAYLDSMSADRTAAQQPYYQTTFGRFSQDRNATDPRGSGPSRAAFLTLFAGVVPANADSMIRGWADARVSLSGVEASADVRNEVLTLGTILGFHARRTGPALDTASISPLVRFQSFLARGDSARARRELATLDAQVNEATDQAFDGNLLFAAESHLELGDSSTALTQMQAFAAIWPRIWFNRDTFLPLARGAGVNAPVRLAGRAWLLYADLSMARAMNDEARRGYRMVVGLWERGEPPVQPMVARARAALAKLGG